MKPDILKPQGSKRFYTLSSSSLPLQPWVGLGLLPYNIIHCNNVTQGTALLTMKLETSNIAAATIKPDNNVIKTIHIVSSNPTKFYSQMTTCFSLERPSSGQHYKSS